jgi:hypothetical protein
MEQTYRLSRWWIVVAAALAVLPAGAWLCWRWLGPGPGSFEVLDSRLRVGMSLDEAVGTMRAFDHEPHAGIDGAYSKGTTKDGQPWSDYHIIERQLYDTLPPAGEIEQGLLTVCDDGGQDLEVTLGPGGVVTAKRLIPGVWEYRLEKGRRALEDAKANLSSGAWWADQVRKTLRVLENAKANLSSGAWWADQVRKMCRSMCRRPGTYAFWLGAAVVLVWLWRRGAAWGRRAANPVAVSPATSPP